MSTDQRSIFKKPGKKNLVYIIYEQNVFFRTSTLLPTFTSYSGNGTRNGNGSDRVQVVLVSVGGNKLETHCSHT